ncbi:hypothetical protein X011_06705 [Mycobacterium tuberculosis variant microti OV254]|nr:hypothetical protein X011_06705 [Mycobacterium tuberculosis variant microti OV254]
MVGDVCAHRLRGSPPQLRAVAADVQPRPDELADRLLIYP